MKESAQVVLINEDGLILAVSRKDNHEDFGLPGGKVDPGETPEQAAIRETKEETGLEIYDLQLVFAMFKNGYMGYTYLAKYSGEINHNEPHVVKWDSFYKITQGSFGKFNQLVAESLDGMDVKYKKIEYKTLYDKISSLMSKDEWAWFHFEDMTENHTKYLRALLTEADLCLRDGMDSTCEKLMNFAHEKSKISKESEEKLMKIVNSKIDLKKIKNIQGYTEFDLVEWDFKSNPNKFKIKFKPKGVPVSFWHADPADIIYDENT